MRKRSRERIRVLLDSWSLQLIIDYLYSILWYAERVNVFDFESNDYLTIASGSLFCLLLWASGFFHISWATPYGLLMFKWSFFISLCVWPMTHCQSWSDKLPSCSNHLQCQLYLCLTGSPIMASATITTGPKGRL